MEELENTQGPKAITLQEFNGRIKRLVNDPSVQRCWVTAEISDFKVNKHCYFELIQKDGESGNTIAKIRVTIWGNVYQMLSSKFTAVTGQSLGNGIKVMVCLSATYHEQYGLSAVVTDINPEFTLGDVLRRRKEIIERLQKEGLLEKNRTTPLIPVPQRIAIISSIGAAGYGDFMKQLTELEHNPSQIIFYTCLFNATMQGVNTESTILEQFNRIEQHKELFDCVVLIRGGGSSDDLGCFDNYEIAKRVANFPLRVIVGIGHERDITVMDYVAGVRVKTPTAAASFLVQCGEYALGHLTELSNAVVSTAKDYIARSNEQLSYYSSTIPMLANHIVETSKLQLQRFIDTIPMQVSGRINAEQASLDRTSDRMRNAADQILLREKMRYDSLKDKVQLLSPRNILNRGYSLVVLTDAKELTYITDVSQLSVNTPITIHLRDGKVLSTVGEIKPGNKK